MEGIDNIQPESNQGVSVITGYFRLSRDIDDAMRDGRFTVGQRHYEIRLRYLEGQRSTLDGLANNRVKTASGVMVSLSDLV